MTSRLSPALWPAEADKAPCPEMTLDEWIDLPEDVSGELVDGRLEEDEVPEVIHELVVTWFTFLFRGWLAGKRGWVIGSGAKVVISARGGRMPDASVYLPGRRPPPRRGALRAPPDIALEVVSPSPRDERRDRVEKMSEYAAAGIRYYWILDPALGSLEIFELEPTGRYARALAATTGVITSVPGCPGLSLDLGALWAELATLSPDGDD